jgi:predicted thioesterase
MKVRVSSRPVHVQGRLYSFDVEAFEGAEKIVETTHTPASVATVKFASRIEAERIQAAGGR